MIAWPVAEMQPLVFSARCRNPTEIPKTVGSLIYVPSDPNKKGLRLCNTRVDVRVRLATCCDLHTIDRESFPRHVGEPGCFDEGKPKVGPGAGG